MLEGLYDWKGYSFHRSGGARIAEMAGVQVDDIRIAGQWNSQALESVYLSKLNRPVMRVLGDWPKEAGKFWIARASKEPSDSLSTKIFPEVDEWIVKHQTGEGVESNVAAGKHQSSCKSNSSRRLLKTSGISQKSDSPGRSYIIKVASNGSPSIVSTPFISIT